MKDFKEIIDIIIKEPGLSDANVYNKAQTVSNKKDVETSIETLKMITSLRKLDMDFLEDVKDAID